MFPICTTKCCMYLEKDSICLKKWHQKFAKQIKFKDSIYGKELNLRPSNSLSTTYRYLNLGISILVLNFF